MQPVDAPPAALLQTGEGSALFPGRAVDPSTVDSIQIGYGEWNTQFARDQATRRWKIDGLFLGKTIGDTWADSPRIDHLISLLGSIQVIPRPEERIETSSAPFKLRLQATVKDQKPLFFLELTPYSKIRAAQAVVRLNQDESKTVFVTGAALEMLDYFKKPDDLRQRRLFWLLSDDVSAVEIRDQNKKAILSVERFDQGQKQSWKLRGGKIKTVEFDPLLEQITHLQIKDFLDQPGHAAPSKSCLLVQFNRWIGDPVQAVWCADLIQTSERPGAWFKLHPQATSDRFRTEIQKLPH